MNEFDRKLEEIREAFKTATDEEFKNKFGFDLYKLRTLVKEFGDAYSNLTTFIANHEDQIENYLGDDNFSFDFRSFDAHVDEFYRNIKYI